MDPDINELIVGATDTFPPSFAQCSLGVQASLFNVSQAFKPLFKLPKTGQQDFMENIHRETNKQIRERKVFLEYVICKAAAVPVAHSLAIYC